MDKNMIPDQPFNFNDFGPLRTFQAQEVRARQLFLQDVTPTSETSRHQLLVCPVCKHLWYKADRQEYTRLTPEQLVSLGALLRVDTQALYLHPRAICTICSALHLDGMFSAEVYPHGGGYRLLWESASPRRIQLLAMICAVEELTLDALVQMIPGRFAEPLSEVSSVLTWLETETCSFTETTQTLSEVHSQRLARSFPLRNTADERPRCWRGYAWETNCPLLGGHALVSLAVTTRCDALPPLSSLRLSWQVLARAIRVVL
jgi:hypothetical protein